MSDKKPFEKLPEFAKPYHYNVTLKPNLVDFTFQGQETISLKVLAATPFLKFHSAEIEILEATINGQSAKATVDEKLETVELRGKDEIAAGEAKVDLKFRGTLNDKMKGFYRSKYKAQDGKEHYMASTQFESTSARKAFPCWDEPVYKATFDIKLVVDEKYTALSNMKAIATKSVEGGKQEVTYATTPIMSTYLIAFAVGDFEYIEGKTKTGVDVRVYTLPGKSVHGKFALEVATRCLEWYNEFFDVAYPISKCDLIAIPDFAMGAMENWGLVTYREVLLLQDPAKSSKRVKSLICVVVAHELAHMWFGNLVTMKWWSDLWLKEGFASFIEYLFTAANYPEFDIWMRFITDETSSAMGLDAFKSSHPIEVPIENPNELEEIYDSITYAKSNTIIRMLFHYLGEEAFRTGIRAYLKEFQYSNAVTVDLWKAFSKASQSDVNTLMRDWTAQIGLPLLDVQEVEVADNKRTISIKQGRFIADGSSDADNLMWRVPISITTSSDPTKTKFKVLMTEREQKFELDGVKKGDWIKLNAGMVGYYRVDYSKEMLTRLLPAVRDQLLTSEDRFNLVSDLYAMVKAGKAEATSFLALASASASQETEFTVWDAIDSGLGSLANVARRVDGAGEKIDAFFRKTYAPVLDKLGKEPQEGEGFLKSQLRSMVLGRLGSAGHTEIVEFARQTFKEHVDKEKEIAPDIRGVVYHVVAKHGGMDAFEQLKKIAEKNEFPEVQVNAVGALSASSDVSVQKAALDYCFKQGGVRPQDFVRVYFGLIGTKTGQETGWDYMKANYRQLMDSVGGANAALFQRMLKSAASGHCCETVATELESIFLSGEHANTLKMTVNQAAEAVRLNVGLLKRDGDKIKTWLTEKGY